jgi:hypothetical protein
MFQYALCKRLGGVDVVIYIEIFFCHDVAFELEMK